MSDKPVAAFKITAKGTIATFDLGIRPGRIVGLAGLLGSGRTETAEVIFGIKPADRGTALIKRQTAKPRSPHQASVLGIGFLPGRRETDGIIAAASMRENIILALQAQRGWLRPISHKNSKRLPNALSASLASAHLQLNNRLNFSLAAISKSVASTLATDPTAISDPLMEPTRGIDVGAHAEIIRLIETLCADGLALLVISPNWKNWWAMPTGDHHARSQTGGGDPAGRALRSGDRQRHCGRKENSVMPQSPDTTPPEKALRFNHGMPQLAALLLVLVIDSPVAPHLQAVVQGWRLFGSPIDILNAVASLCAVGYRI